MYEQANYSAQADDQIPRELRTSVVRELDSTKAAYW